MYLFIECFTSYLVPCQLYCDDWLEGQRKPVHTVNQGSILSTADQQQTTRFPT